MMTRAARVTATDRALTCHSGCRPNVTVQPRRQGPGGLCERVCAGQCPWDVPLSERAQRAVFVDGSSCTRDSSEFALKSTSYYSMCTIAIWPCLDWSVIRVGKKGVRGARNPKPTTSEMIPGPTSGYNIRVPATPVCGTVTVLLPVGACQWQCGT